MILFFFYIGVIAVGIFADNPIPLDTTSGRVGLFHGGGWYLLGVQSLTALCLALWGFFSSVILLYVINKIVMIRMPVHHELMGADLSEHHVKHGGHVSNILSIVLYSMPTSFAKFYIFRISNYLLLSLLFISTKKKKIYINIKK